MSYEKLKQSASDVVKEMGFQFQKTVDKTNELVNSVKDSDKLQKTLDGVEKSAEKFLNEVEGVGVALKNAFVDGMEAQKANKSKYGDGVPVADDASVKEESSSSEKTM